jgi:hypothetical protein
MATVTVNGVQLDIDEGVTVKISKGGEISVGVQKGDQADQHDPNEFDDDSSVDASAMFDDAILGTFNVAFNYQDKSGKKSMITGTVTPADSEHRDDDKIAHVKTASGWRSVLRSGVLEGFLFEFDRVDGEQTLVRGEQAPASVVFDRLERAARYPYLSASIEPIRVKGFSYENAGGEVKSYEDYDFLPSNLHTGDVRSILTEKNGEYKLLREDRFLGVIEL